MRKYNLGIFILTLAFLFCGSANANLNDGLVAFYPFNGNANDESGNGNNGTVYGAGLTADRHGNLNSAYNFDGINDYIDIGNNVKPQFPITVSAWVKLDQFDKQIAIFRNDQVDSGSYRYGLVLAIDDIGKFGVGYYEGFSTSSNRQKLLVN
ncbi:MAG: hypothetical protein R2875_07210 [Desulfobacterales bacterium]